jgi:subtilisin family serine protease
LHAVFHESRSYAVGLRRLFLILAATGLGAALVPAANAGTSGARTEFLVTLNVPSLATAVAQSRVLSARSKHTRLDTRSPTSVSYLRGLASTQRTLQRRIAAVVPDASVRWRYQVVLDGMSVVASPADAARLSRLPGVAHVYPALRYHALERQGYQVIGAPALWGPRLSTAGQGIKIGIIDDGVDQRHPYLSPSGLSMPPGFPKGKKRYTTRKVIVARAFAPPHPKWRYAHLPFDPALSEHGTHVAGIAAGDYNTNADGTFISGVAPRAYIGNYKVLSIPTASGVGPDGNAPEIVAGIEAAVRDGMDVINLSLGEPEVNPHRDPVIKAIDGAAEAGVVPTIAAGNDFSPFGFGSVASPGSAPRAITAAAATRDSVIAGFSSAGPTPVSHRMKPDVTAPGVDILSSVPRSDGTWASWAGTSMASPHVAGAAALLRQRHPTWTVAQIKSALVLTGQPVYTGPGHRAEVRPAREGGGMLDLPRADRPLLFARPSSLSFGCLRPGKRVTRTIALTDAGGGAGSWTVAVRRMGSPKLRLRHPAEVAVPGTLRLTASHVPASTQGSGFILLTRRAAIRRIPFWYCGTANRLSRHGYRVLRRTGMYSGNTRHHKALISRYRFPDLQPGAGVATLLRGPEQVFRVHLRRRVANFGVGVVSSPGPGIQIQPRVVYGANENHLAGYPALPLNLNPYLSEFLAPVPAAGVVLPAQGKYSIVFDSKSRKDAGKFHFRFWINDTTPPLLKLRTKSAPQSGSLRIQASDAGSGVDPDSIQLRIDGHQFFTWNYSRAHHRITVPLGQIARGAHRLRLQVSDFQESRNMEDVGPILPNTRVLHSRFRVSG